jgi:predicted nucleotidyltransferase component of viral defense system
MHEEALAKNTKSVLGALSVSGVAKNFYLAGGTALALHLGHRFSVDLDWFAEKFNYTPIFRSQLEKLGKLGVDSESENTFNGTLNGVKVSFFKYPYPLMAPKILYKKNVYLAGIPDIAAMKIEAIGSRGSYKDFIDIYFLLKEYSLKELLDFVHKKFANIEYNEAHLLKALTYFKDARGSSAPRLIKKVSWQEVTGEIKRSVGAYLKNYGK